MDHKTPSQHWVYNDFPATDAARFLVIFEIDGGEEGKLVPRFVPLRATEASRQAGILVHVLTGILLDNRLFADPQVVCVRAVRDGTLLSDPVGLPDILRLLIPMVQSLLDAWGDSIAEPGPQSEQKLLYAQAMFLPKVLTDLKAALLQLATTRSKRMVFGDLQGERFDLLLPPKQSLKPPNTQSAISQEGGHRIKSIEHLTLLANDTGTVHLVPTANIPAEAIAGTVVELVKARDPAPVAWRSARSVRLRIALTESKRRKS